MTLDDLAVGFNAANFDWSLARPFGVINKFTTSRTSKKMTSGKILAQTQELVSNFLTMMGVQLCIFKIGVTSNPLSRFQLYKQQYYSHMWIIFCCESVDLIHMLEAALIAASIGHKGCRNQPGSGGEGALNRVNPPEPPYFVYIVGGRADQTRCVG